MKKKILLIDDDKNIINSFQRQLRKDFIVFTGLSGADAISLINKNDPFPVIVSDYRMSNMDGIELLSRIRNISPDTTRIMLTGEADLQTAINAVNEGNVFRFLTKPCPINILVNTINTGIEHYDLIVSERELLEKTLKGSIKVLIDTLSIISPVTFASALRYRKITNKIATRLNLKNIWELELTALLSQIGCISVPLDIIEKRNKGLSLSRIEEKIFFSHPEIGSKLLSSIPRLENIVEAILYQFKGFDGSGSPQNDIVEKKIPLSGRILKIVIDFDLLTENGMSKSKAFKVLISKKKKYDPDILAALEAEVREVQSGFIIRSIKLKEISSGMVLAEEIRDIKGGLVLIPNGSEITPALHSRLNNFSRLGHIKEPIKILVEK